jgi:hypothetical protein
VDDNGEVAWPKAEAAAVVNALADAGRVVLGLDLRTYDADGVLEVAWSDFGGSDPEAARQAALVCLAREDFPAELEWVLITW